MVVVALPLALLLALAGRLVAGRFASSSAATLAGLAPAMALAVALRVGAGTPFGSLLLEFVIFATTVGFGYLGWLAGVRSARRRAGRALAAGGVAVALCAAALLWAGTLFVAGFTYPAYAVDCAPDPQACADVSRTLVGVNGAVAVLALAIPLVAAAAVTALLSLRCRRGGRGAIVAATAVVTVLLVFGIVSGFSVGLYVLPLVPLLAAALLLTPDPADPTPAA